MQHRPDKAAGFTLVEMIIAMGIFAILSAMSVSSYANFNNKIGTDLLVHSIAQDGHLAQVESMAVKRAANGGYPGYGVNFDLTRTSGNTFYDFYADLNGDNRYATSVGACPIGECEKHILLEKGTSLSRVCVSVSPSGTQGACGAGYTQAQGADISFKRPSTDAKLLYNNGSTWLAGAVSSIRIYIKSAKGYERAIEFWSTGQISIIGQNAG